MISSRNIISLSDACKIDEELLGRKAYQLGIFWKLGIPLLNGFVITVDFFKDFLRLTGIDKEIKKIESINHPALSSSVEKLFYPVQKQIMQKHLPQALSTQFHRFYRELSTAFKEKSFDVFSSSFNNKSIAFTNVKGDANLLLKIKTIWSKSFDKPVAIVIQEHLASGVKSKITTVSSVVDKNLTKSQMDKLTDYCRIIQKCFYFPYEVEYIVNNGKLFVLKVQPFTGIVNKIPKKELGNKAKVQNLLAKGTPMNPGIATGHVKIIHDIRMNHIVKKGDIVVLKSLYPSMLHKIKNAKAVIVETTLHNSLSKTLCRKSLRIPTVVNAKNLTQIFRNGNVITVNGTSGEIYSGGLL
jgi:phosphoenolpyruvate synthase/pyruvate phosphate dikinase